MNYETIENRHSVRAYTGAPIPHRIKVLLDELIARCNAEGGLDICFSTDEPDVFGKSLTALYGRFSNVRNYFCMMAEKAPDAEERIGYYGEMLVLKANELGLNTCWVGMTFNRRKLPFDIPENEKLYAVIAVGYGQNQGSKHKIKSPSKICKEIAETPEWFQRGVDCALLAPTALNQQRFHFKWLGDLRVKASTSFGFYTKIDLGIAKYHFELGAYPVKVEWI